MSGQRDDIKLRKIEDLGLPQVRMLRAAPAVPLLLSGERDALEGDAEVFQERGIICLN